MSGIVGIYHLDGRPIDRLLLDRMNAAIAHRGEDDSGSWVDGSVGMGHRMSHTTPESLFEKQPLANEAADEKGQVCLVFDGRIDNREELTAALTGKGFAPRQGVDAEIVLLAYQAWGEACAQRIIGDFTFAIWDAQRRELFCARDFMGNRPFYYYFDGKTFLWASELHALFESPAVSRGPNEAMIGEYLTSYVRNVTETLFQGVLRLPPAHSLVVSAAGLQLRRYWDLDPSKEIVYSTDEQYAGHFYDLFRESVRSKMRAVGPIASDLSGGLDSSSVVGMAQSLLREGGLACEGFETFSWVFPGSVCDESDYIDDVISKWGLVAHKVEPLPAALGRFREQVALYQDFPGYPNGSTVCPLRPLARSRGCRVVLTGEGGDEWITGTRGHSLDLLLQLQFGQAVRESYRDGGSKRLASVFRDLIHTCVWPAIPRMPQRLIRMSIGRSEVPEWIGRDFARRSLLAERLRQKEYAPRQASYSQMERYSSITDGWNVHLKEVQDRVNAYHRMDARHPFNDRRIVEFGLALPEEQRRRNGIDKFILRNAGRDFLPATIQSRRDKAAFPDMFSKQLRMLGGASIFESLEIARLGWVNGDKVRAMYRQMEQFSVEGFRKPTTYVWILWMVFGIDLWWQSLFSQPTPYGVPAHSGVT